MIKIGITGNIGTGKSYVANILIEMGYPVYNADQNANRLMQSPEMIMHISDRFGLGILTPDGLPDRKKIAAIVFTNPLELKWLEGLIHPMVMKDWEQWLDKYPDATFAFMESAILFEHDLDKHFDAIILITAPVEVAIERVIKRDNATKEEATARLNKQMAQSEKEKLTRFIVENDGKQPLLPQIQNILELI